MRCPAQLTDDAVACAKEGKRVTWSIVLQNSDFRPEFRKVVNHMLTIEEFEECWKYLIKKYNLKSHDYMTNL